MEEMAVVILFVGVLIFLAHAFAALFEKARIPDVLSLVLLGLAIGPLTGWVKPESLGQLGPVFTTLTLVIILFEAGLGLDFASLRQALAATLRLTLANYLVSMVVLGVLASRWLGLPVLVGLTLGAIVSGTSSGEVVPMVGKMRLQPVSRVTLMLEATFTDVLCIVFTLGFLEAIRLHDVRPGLMLGHMFSSFLMAGVIGVAGAIAWSATLGKVRGLQNSLFTTPAFVFVLFGITELLGFSGAIAALGFGVTLGNISSLRKAIHKVAGIQPVHLNEVERSFFAEIVFVMKTFFFVYIGLSIQLGQWTPVLAGLLLSLVAFLLRLPVVRLTTTKTTPRLDAALMAVVIPKGLAAAALASLPIQQGVAGGELIQAVAYALILFTIVLSAALSFLLESRGVVQPYRLIFSSYAPLPEAGEKTGM